MKKLLFLFVLAFGFSFSQAQEKIYTIDEVYTNPEFPGGSEAMMKYIARNFEMPEDGKAIGIIELSFVVEPSGKLTNIKIVKDANQGIGAEIVRLFASSPKWNPGKLKDGTPAKVMYTMPLSMKSN